MFRYQFAEMGDEERLRYFATEIKNIIKKYYTIKNEKYLSDVEGYFIDFFDEKVVDWGGSIWVGYKKRFINPYLCNLPEVPFQLLYNQNKIVIDIELPSIIRNDKIMEKIHNRFHLYKYLSLEDIHWHGENTYHIHITVEPISIYDEEGRKNLLREIEDFASLLSSNKCTF